MRTFKNKIIFSFLLFVAMSFSSCEDASTELTIESKVEILESDEWLLKDFEDRVMHTFANGERFTYYGTDSNFDEDAIPGTQTYTISGELLIMDFNFGNISTYEVKVFCNNNILEFYRDGELNTTLYRRGSNYKECL
jgi:hypothetical protein